MNIAEQSSATGSHGSDRRVPAEQAKPDRRGDLLLRIFAHSDFLRGISALQYPRRARSPEDSEELFAGNGSRKSVAAF